MRTNLGFDVTACCSYPPDQPAARVAAFPVPRCTAFTLIELLLVLTVIGILASLVYPIVGGIRRRAELAASTQLVHAVASAVIASPQTPMVLASGGAGIRRRWDLDGDGEIDGDPAAPGNATLATLAPAGHRHLASVMTGALPTWGVDARGRIQDRWRRPLRIVFSTAAYGTAGVNVISAGRDSLDARDDLSSWASTR